MKKTVGAILVLGLTVSTSATIINIPDDYPTIQQGIDASDDGDTVLVQPGSSSTINFNGHGITVASLYLTTGDESYILNTSIFGGVNPNVTIPHSDSGTPKLIGFTIHSGSIGIHCIDSSPLIAHNYIRNINDMSFFDEAYAVGVFCENAGALLSYNIIDHVSSFSFYGSARAFGVQCSGSNIEMNNNIIANVTTSSVLDEISSGFYCLNSHPILRNNTIVSNGHSLGGGVYSLNSSPKLSNDIIWYNMPEDVYGPVVTNYCNSGSDLQGIGNLRLMPKFVDREHGNFHLMSIACGDSADSPCIDTGDPLVADGVLDCLWGLGGLRSDMGAYGGGDSITVGIFDSPPSLPERLTLFQNYSNPFNAQTTIRFVLPESGNVQLTIYDLLGRRIETIIGENRQAGVHTISWDASTNSSGIYFARLETKNETKSIKMLLLK